MKAPRYITSFQVQNSQPEGLNISLGCEGNGTMRLCFQDTAELGQDSNYINESAFPNSGSMAHGKYSMWLSMFGRLVRPLKDDEIG